MINQETNLLAIEVPPQLFLTMHQLIMGELINVVNTPMTTLMTIAINELCLNVTASNKYLPSMDVCMDMHYPDLSPQNKIYVKTAIYKLGAMIAPYFNTGLRNARINLPAIPKLVSLSDTTVTVIFNSLVEPKWNTQYSASSQLWTS